MENKEKITVVVEQEGKKAIITITDNKEQGRMDVKAEWQPALDKEHPQGKDLLTMQILEILRG